VTKPNKFNEELAGIPVNSDANANAEPLIKECALVPFGARFCVVEASLIGALTTAVTCPKVNPVVRIKNVKISVIFFIRLFFKV
jgi:hypothetical protein